MSLLLEEEVAVVHYVALHVKLVHEVASILHCSLAELLLLELFVELARTVCLVQN